MKLTGAKWNHYEELYQRHLSGNSILEIGVDRGASHLRHLRLGFSHVFGIDVNKVEVPGVKLYTGSVMDKAFMSIAKSDIASRVGKLDVIIDDASHRPYHQYRAFKELWNLLADGGVYCIEDLQVACNRKWSLWTFLGLPSVPKLLLELYRRQHAWSDVDEYIARCRPYEIHMYPNTIFIKKCWTQIVAIKTEEQV